MLDYSQEEKEIFMSEALKEAQKSLDKAEIPIGCVIVKDREIVLVISPLENLNSGSSTRPR